MATAATAPEARLLGHLNNISQKVRIADSPSRVQLCKDVVAAYDSYIAQIDLPGVLSGDFIKSIAALNSYVDFTKAIEAKESFFNWRSDFAASVIPEYLYRVFSARLQTKGVNALFSSRSSVVEVSLAGTVAGGWELRMKNQDLCVGLRMESVIKDGAAVPFVVPVIVFEVKTNIDINKLNGLDFSAERLKRTFPTARYFLVTETIDFSLAQNYASGSIDEIYVLRKQLRSLARRAKEPLQPDVFAQLTLDLEELMLKANRERGHVYDRLEHGKLIDA